MIITGFKLINFRNQANKKLLNKINMKKTLLIIVLFIGLGNLSAQDSTNNATLEETIGFIAKYSEKIKSVKVCCLGEFMWLSKREYS